MSLTGLDLEAYRSRLGLAEWPARGLAGLTTLIRSQLRAIPFENLDVVARRPLSLELPALEKKILHGRRGGFCFELNHLFGELLRAQGYEVDYLQARIAGAAGFTAPFAHLCLRVQLDRPYLVDVGFTRSPLAPIPLEAGGEGVVNGHSHRLSALESDLLLEDSELGGPWSRCYRIELRSHPISAFDEQFRFLGGSPDSFFARAPLCIRATEAGWVRFLHGTLTETRGGEWLDPIPVGRDRWPSVFARFGLEHVTL
jgi:N-hydroxyarylamine O-acetyltransferase